jgi:hypothetical protein
MNNPTPLQSARSRVEAATAQLEATLRRADLCASMGSPTDVEYEFTIDETEIGRFANDLRLAVNTLKRLLSEEGQEVMAKIIDPEAWSWRPLPREANEGPASKRAYDEMDRNDTRDIERRKDVARAKAQAAVSAILGNQP